MTTIYLLLGASLVTLAVVWLALREARRGGKAEAREEEAKHVVDNAERINAARDAAPSTPGELAERVQSGRPL